MDELWLIGAGRMGLSLLAGWLEAGLVSPKKPVFVVEPSPGPALEALVVRKIARVKGPPFDIAATRRFIVLAVKPQMLAGALAAIRPLAEHAGLLSIVAGKNCAGILAALGNPRGAEIVRAMPNTPAQIGKGISTLYAPPGTSEAARARAAQLLAAAGDAVWVAREELIDAGTAISGSGPAYYFLLTEALARAGEELGLPRADAERLARATLVGSGALLGASQDTPAALREAVTSPGGTTRAALDVLMAEPGIDDLIRRAARAAFMRAQELGK